jgi:hypothetical protein
LISSLPNLKKKMTTVVQCGVRRCCPGEFNFAEPDHEPATLLRNAWSLIPKELSSRKEGSGSLTELICDP